jgi:imidazolonepropionase-like amidohydrolase
MCVGTDSLSSNWRLSILEEIKTIKKYQSKVADRELLKWATYNGAKALKYDDRLGSIARDKSPGINLIDVDVISNNFDLQGARSIRRLDL